LSPNVYQVGTLMRVEADTEFRIYREDVEGCPISEDESNSLPQRLFASLENFQTACAQRS
jgi:hypothetical protein